jgi:plastocyanin
MTCPTVARLRATAPLAGIAVATLLSLAPAAAETAPGLRTGVERRAEATVRIENFTFDPPEITVAPGTTVTWINRDDIPHTVAETGRRFRSKVLDTEMSFSFTFETEGDYAYFCSLHPHMTGAVKVRRNAMESRVPWQEHP